jgi:hypothetical protein
VLEAERARAAHARERSDLAQELNERMRVHAPRAHDLALNTGRARVAQVEARRAQLERHFQQAAEQFNDAAAALEAAGERRAGAARDSLESLRAFVPRLAEQPTAADLQQLGRRFAAESEAVARHTEGLIAAQEREVAALAGGFASSTERFIAAFAGASAEERELCAALSARMAAQVSAAAAALGGAPAALRAEAEALRRRIADEFDAAMAEHRADVELLARIDAAQADAKKKLDALLFSNKQANAAVAAAVAAVAAARAPAGERPALVERQFERLDAMRVAIVKRAKVLGELRSRISHQTTALALAWIPDPGSSESSSIVSDSPAKRAVARPKSSRSARPESSRRGAARHPPPAAEAVEPLQTAVDLIGAEVAAEVAPAVAEYYGARKPKARAARPDKVPPSAPECAEMVRRAWEAAAARVPAVLEECGAALRRQIADAVDAAKEAVPYITELFLAFYIDQVSTRAAEARTAFKEALRTLRGARRANRDALRPTLADPNNVERLAELVAKEAGRTADETRLVRVLDAQLSAIEDAGLRVFVLNLQSLTQQLLSLFDAFVMLEDLREGPVQATPRLTLKQMLKEKHRRMANPKKETRQVRQWPPIAPTIAVAVAAAPPEPAAETPKASPARRGGRKRKLTLPESPEKRPPDKLAVPASLDTAIHRTVIAHRNRVYTQYEKELTERLERTKETVVTFTREIQVFAEHWNGCLTSLKTEARAMS